MKILKVDVETKEVPDYGMVMHVPVMEQIMAKSKNKYTRICQKMK